MERCQRLDYELARLREESVQETMTVSFENERLKREISGYIDKLGSIRNESAEQANQLMTTTLEQINSKFEETIKTIERSAFETAKKKFEVQKAQDYAAMQSECARQIEVVKTQLKLAHSAELDSVRKHFESREAQTISDLKHLEQLQSQRVSDLESSLYSWRHRAEKAEEHASIAVVSAAKNTECSRNLTIDKIKQLELHAEMAETLKATLQQKNDELLESKSRETALKDHLQRAIEECRIQRAQTIDALRQASQNAAEAVHWKKSFQDIEIHLQSSKSKFQIAQDEALMLENEVERLSLVNSNLQRALDHADDIVYGKPISSIQLKDVKRHSLHEPQPLTRITQKKLAQQQNQIERELELMENSYDGENMSNNNQKLFHEKSTGGREKRSKPLNKSINKGSGTRVSRTIHF